MTDCNVYNRPEHFGLEIIGEVNYSYGYDWDIAVVFRNIETDLCVLEQDSGCSCSSPFEYETDTDSWQWDTRINVANALLALSAKNAAYYDYDRDDINMQTAEVIGRLVA
jgi:hypothetical protein